jgi:uncharacterized protein YciI
MAPTRPRQLNPQEAPMTDRPYPHGDALIPDRFDAHTMILLVRPPEPRHIPEDELDRLQEQHLAYLRDLMRQGVLIANGPLTEQTNPRIRGVSIYGVPLAEALELAEADPMVRAGRLTIEGATWLTAAGWARFGPGDADERPNGP